MIGRYIKKLNHSKINRKLLIKLIQNIDISNSEKRDLIEAISIVDRRKILTLYDEIYSFIQKNELKNIEDIEKTNFIKVGGMTRKQANKKKTQLNSISFLFNKI